MAIFILQLEYAMEVTTEKGKTSNQSTVPLNILRKAYQFMHTAMQMATLYDENKAVCSKYVHSTSRGHEAIQLAASMQLKAYDFAAPYYRDDSILLGIGLTPYELMLQLLGKKDDPFSGGRTYYGHPSLRRKGFPTIPHQSSATGMQAIPATGMAHALNYLEAQNLADSNNRPLVLCSLGDGSVTEGEVSEAFQMAVLHQLPIVYLIQDNDWGISATGKEMRAMDAYEFAAGFKGMERMRIDGSDFVLAYEGIKKAYSYVRSRKGPILVHAKTPLLGHHTSGVRKEWYREDFDLEDHQKDDPIPKLRKVLKSRGLKEKDLVEMEDKARAFVQSEYARALNADDPAPETVEEHEFAPTPIQEEKGERNHAGRRRLLW